MKIEYFGKVYVALMSGYFLISGFSALFDIDSKLSRIGLNAVDLDGKVAFILIYCSLMVGIGLSIILIAYLSKTWFYSAALATSILCSFILFRFVGSYMVGTVTELQLTYMLTEAVEAGIGMFLLVKSNHVVQASNKRVNN